MAIESVSAAGLQSASPIIRQLGIEGQPTVQTAQKADGASFQNILMSGLNNVDQKIATADDLVRQFALDDSVPVHQVTMALEEARLSVEMAMQVRARLVEGYRELMNMQL